MQQPFRLRRYQDRDFEEVSGWVSDRRVFAYWGGSWFDFPLPRKRFQEHHLEGSHIGYAVVDAGDSPAGYFEIRELEPREGRLFRVIVKRECRNRGIGRDMLAEALRIGFAGMHLEKVGLGVFSDNEAARRCYLATGFSETGVRSSFCDLLDEEITIVNMEISREEWEMTHRVV